MLRKNLPEFPQVPGKNNTGKNHEQLPFAQSEVKDAGHKGGQKYFSEFKFCTSRA